MRTRLLLGFFGHVLVAFFLFPASSFAQWIEPSGGNPVTIACPNGPSSGAGIDPKESWKKGREAASIEGDGVLGVGNFGHTQEALEWYCKSSAAGNPVAAFDIGEILREGYVTNAIGPGGYIKTTHYMPDVAAAFYWYQLAANSGYTKAMLAVAQYFGSGDIVLKGSGIRRDAALSLKWLKQAADAGDTDALQILAALYEGQRTVPWAANISVTADRKNANALNSKINERLTLLRLLCTDSEEVQIMAGMLPDASLGRQVRTAAIIEANPNGVTCMLSLSDPPPSQQNEPVLNQLSRLIHGGAVTSWFFSIIQMPGNDDTPQIVRQTATQAMIQNVERLAVLLQSISPSSNSVPSTPTRQTQAYPSSNSSTAQATQQSSAVRTRGQSLNLTGSWLMRTKLPGDQTLTIPVNIKQNGDEVTMSMRLNTGVVEIFKGTMTSRSSIVGQVIDPDSGDRGPATIRIDGPNHLTPDYGDDDLTRILP